MKIGTICEVFGEGDEMFIIRDISGNSFLVENCFKKSIPCWEQKFKLRDVSERKLEKRIQYSENQINDINKAIELLKEFLNNND